MHGRVKVKTSEDKLREKKELEKKQSIEYSTLLNKILDARKQNIKDFETLKLTEKLLTLNADGYTIWNYRREIVLHLSKDPSQLEAASLSVNDLFQYELKLTEKLIPFWHKSYWVWNHRCWVSENIEMDWERELELCRRLHQQDARNFHCWNHRRFVIAKANIEPSREIELTTELINHNFSNYSAWHHRSLFLKREYENQPELYREKILEEFEYVKQAFFTEPEDQSAWIYHRWLVHEFKKVDPENYVETIQTELQACRDLLEMEEESKWPMLTIVFLLLELGESKDEVQDLVKKLQRVDPVRNTYYKDLENKLSS